MVADCRFARGVEIDRLIQCRDEGCSNRCGARCCCGGISMLPKLIVNLSDLFGRASQSFAIRPGFEEINLQLGVTDQQFFFTSC